MRGHALAAIWRFLTNRVVVAVSPWAGTTLGGVLISGANGSVGQIVTGSVIVLLGILPAGASARVELLSQEADDASVVREAVVNEIITGVMEDAVAAETMTRQQRVGLASAKVRELVETLTASIYRDIPGVRAVYFTVTADRQRLVPEVTSGRQDAARTFDANEERTVAAIERLDEPDGGLLVEDTAELPQLGAEGRSYRSFVSAPVRVGNEAFGMLNVDSTTEGTFADLDLKLVRRVATAIAFYVATAERGRHGRSQTTTVDSSGEGGDSDDSDVDQVE